MQKWKNNAQYYGEWKNDQINGQGMLKNSKGDHYNG
jgi:hypothetical protein